MKILYECNEYVLYVTSKDLELYHDWRLSKLVEVCLPLAFDSLRLDMCGKGIFYTELFVCMLGSMSVWRSSVTLSIIEAPYERCY